MRVKGMVLGRRLGGDENVDVFVAEHNGMEYAVKVPAFGMEGDLLREIAALRITKHRGIVQALGQTVTDDGRPVLVMPALDPGAAAWPPPLCNERTAAFVRALLGAVAHIHAHGMIHGDIRAPNICSRDGEPVLIDFGTAEHESLPPPLHPRVYADGLPVGRHTDTTGVGMVALEMLTGWAVADVLKVPKVPEAVEGWQAFLERALSPEQAARFQTAEEMAAALPY